MRGASSPTIRGAGTGLREEELALFSGGSGTERLVEPRPLRNVYVAAQLEERLPPRLQPLAEPAAAALRRVAEDNAGTLLGTAAAIELWRKANERAHDLFEKVIDEGSGDVTIDLQPLIQRAGERGGLLGRVAEQLPPDAGQLQILQSDQLEGAQKGVDLLRPLAIVLVLLAAALYLIAVLISPDRRRTTVYVGAALLFAAVAVLAVRRIGGNQLVETLAQTPDSEWAVAASWSIGTSLLVDVVSGAALVAILLILGAWLLGPGRVAVPVRRRLTPRAPQPALARPARPGRPAGRAHLVEPGPVDRQAPRHPDPRDRRVRVARVRSPPGA